MPVTAYIQIQINPQLYLKDPESTELGKRIISSSIFLMDEIGYEDFNFKKLAESILSTEASIYRYFKNKHQLLTYIVSWYYGWLEYQIDMQTRNYTAAIDKLKSAIHIITDNINYDPTFSHIDEEILHKVVVRESSKIYYLKDQDPAIQKGYFERFESVVNVLTDFIRDINPNFPYPQALSNMILVISYREKFFVQNIPSVTDLETLTGGTGNEIANFIDFVIFKVLQ
jgi:AcrR family transcriptional regulator